MLLAMDGSFPSVLDSRCHDTYELTCRDRLYSKKFLLLCAIVFFFFFFGCNLVGLIQALYVVSAPVLSLVKKDPQIRHFNNSDHTFRGPPSDSVSEAWDRLTQGMCE